MENKWKKQKLLLKKNKENKKFKKRLKIYRHHANPLPICVKNFLTDLLDFT